MKQQFSLIGITAFLFLTLSLSSCQLAGDLFKGGMWIGAIGVILVVVLIIYIVARMGRKS